MPELERECWQKGTSWVDEDKARGTSGFPGHWETGHTPGLPAASRMTAETKRQRPELQPVHLGVRPDSPRQRAVPQMGCSGPPAPQLSCSAVALRADQSVPVDAAEANTQCAVHRPAPGRHEGPEHTVSGPPLPWVWGSSETRLLLRQRGISMPASPWARNRVQLSQRKFREPRAHAQGLTTTQTSHRQHSGHFPRPPQQTQVASQQVKSPYSLGPRPVSMAKSLCHRPGAGWGHGKELCMGRRGSELLVLGNPAHPMQAWPAVLAVWRGRLPGGSHRCAPARTARLQLPRLYSLAEKVSGTEVYFQEVTVGPRTHSPTLHTPTGTH